MTERRTDTSSSAGSKTAEQLRDAGAGNAVHVRLAHEVAIITVDSPPVNALGARVRLQLLNALETALLDDQALGVVIEGAHRRFIAGADMREFGQARAGPSIGRICACLDGSAKPVVASMEGAVLGGGLELALACHGRVAAPDARLGLPEVTLGLMAAAGGNQRLPRVIGVGPALDLIISGAPVSGREALRIGLVDEVGSPPLERALELARTWARSGQPLPRSCLPWDGIGQSDAAEAAIAAARATAARRWPRRLAPAAAIDSVAAGLTTPFDEAVQRDSAIFRQMESSDESRALRYAFFAERRARKVPDIPRHAPGELCSVAIVGLGTMGSGIAARCAMSGLSVTVADASPADLEAGLGRVRDILDSAATRGKLSTDERDRAEQRIDPVPDLSGIGEVDLVIEAVFEDRAAKLDLFCRLGRVLPPGTVLATNTSSLSVAELATVSGRPEMVIGLHFFSPAHVMRLVEIVRTKESAPGAIARGIALAERIGKVGVLVGDCHEFAANRTRRPMIREAHFLVEDGAWPQDVDRVLRSFGMPMGVFEVADLSGLDVGARIRRENRRSGTGTQRYPHLADRLVEIGRLGRKNGLGWYRYTAAGAPEADPEMQRVIDDYARQAGITRRPISDEEIEQRCLFGCINEAARVLEEGIVLRPSDIDVMWLLGFGFPREKGGLLHHADRLGASAIGDACRRFSETDGERWRLSPLLERMADENGRFLPD
ncbi:MAG: 3-hydroxyacyl-CoA dehydrogenase NAD-binding domain-containing protein [Azospirillaceae bacterium]